MAVLPAGLMLAVVTGLLLLPVVDEDTLVALLAAGKLFSSCAKTSLLLSSLLPINPDMIDDRSFPDPLLPNRFGLVLELLLFIPENRPARRSLLLASLLPVSKSGNPMVPFTPIKAYTCSGVKDPGVLLGVDEL